MKKKLTLVVILISTLIQAQISYADLQDGTTGIATGYGSWGENSVIHETEVNFEVAGTVVGKINFYHPDIAVTQLPTIFFISGWGRPAYTYEYYFHFLASQGYSVVNIYSDRPGDIATSYQDSLDMIIQAAETEYPNWINTSKVGLAGHSYGAGATVWLGKHIFGATHNYGASGRFIFMTAPWYSLMVTESDLLNYPDNVKLLIEVNNDDMHNSGSYNTDERAIRAVFELINIPNDEKDFVRVFSDTNLTFQYDSDNNGTDETYHYDANHYVSYTATSNSHGAYQTYDALDVHAINRLSHALIEYTFNDDLQAKNIALGNNSTAQIDMDFLTDLFVTDTPIITRPQNEFAYECNTNWNDFETGQNTWFLQNACSDTDNDGVIDIVQALSVADVRTDVNFNIYPNPTSNFLVIDGNSVKKDITIIDVSGKIVLRKTNFTDEKLNISALNEGVYFIQIVSNKISMSKKLIIK